MKNYLTADRVYQTHFVSTFYRSEGAKPTLSAYNEKRVTASVLALDVVEP